MPGIQLTYLITDLQVGGVPLHLYRLAKRMADRGMRVRVISLADEGPVGGVLRQYGIPVLACDAKRVSCLAAATRLFGFLRDDRPDVLHAMLFHANMAARAAVFGAGISPSRVICEIQTVEIERRWHLRLDGWTCRFCRFEVGNSRAVIDHLHREAHIPRSRLVQMPGGVECDPFVRAEPIPRHQLGVPPDVPLLIWTGRLDPVKGFEEMLGAFAQITAATQARLLLVGEGAYRTQVVDLIDRLSLTNRVLMLGQRDDVARLLKAADLFLFCSRTEGLPNSVIEAMAAGLPVVCTDIPACRELIQHGRTGLLVQPEPSRIAETVLHLLADPGGWELGRAAQRWVIQNLSADRLADCWATFYNSLCRRREQKRR